MGEKPTERQVADLADAVWQMLNDMHPSGQSVCLFAKAKARVAYEPFRDEPEEESGIMPLAEAEGIYFAWTGRTPDQNLLGATLPPTETPDA